MHPVSGGAPRKASVGDKTVNWRSSRNDREEAARGVASMASPSGSHRTEAEAVVFSIQFYGKTIGEVGLMDQDLSQLDWQRFKSYIFQNLLSMNNQENICISYSDDEGDKLPIESEEEYREALKVAKKKAEAHDKMVLDLTRQGGLPTVFSIVSSGIKRVSSSPPKEGGISFFKSASPPKDSSGFMARSSAPDRRIFPSLFSADRGDEEMPGVGSRPKMAMRDSEQPPEWFTTYMDKFREELCNDVITRLAHMMRDECCFALEADKQKPKNELLQAEMKETPWSSKIEKDIVKDYSQLSQIKINYPTVSNWAESDLPTDLTTLPLEKVMAVRRQRKSFSSEKRNSFPITFNEVKGNLKDAQSGAENCLKKKDVKEDTRKADEEPKSNITQKRSNFEFGFSELSDITKEKKTNGDSSSKKKERDGKENIKSADVGVKRKKSIKEDERFTKWLEKMEEKMARKQGKMEERFVKKHEKLEERLVKKQEKLAERFQKQQEKVERRKPSSKLLDVEKNMRAQGKVLAKMEGLRKKQTCTSEELSKLRKVVDKHHKAADKHHEMDQRQLRRSERKATYLKAGKTRKIDIDAKAFPVDPSLLHKALLELESLAEDSPSESHCSATIGYDAFYVRDITYPDGSQVPPGARFEKTWRVLNSGLMTWNEKTELCKWSQVQFHGSPVNWKLKPLEKKVVCPPLKPGECGNISITFISPNEPGWYATHWRFCQQGRVFGNQIWCAVHVSNSTDANCETQTTCANTEVGPDVAQATISEESEKKESIETETSEEQSSLSEEDVPVFVDATKDTNKMESSVTKSTIAPTSDAIHESSAEPPTLEQQACQSSEYEVGIIENYYDAEDPAEDDTQHLSEVGQDSTSEPEATARTNLDLITFEDEAEMVPSRSPSPDIISHTHSVIPLKDMAKESVDSLRDFMKVAGEKEEKKSCNVSSSYGLDDLSISSGSFSDLDSDDQAILNESDTDISDQDYFVVSIPECFDLTHPYSGKVSINPSGVSQGTGANHEAERHDTPDFLTADEDDRTTTAAHNCVNYQDELADSNSSGVEDNEGISLTGTILEVPQSSDMTVENPQAAQDLKTSDGKVSSLPLHPTETKGFMDIPPEALRANLALSLYRGNIIKTEAEQQHQQQQQQQQQQQESGRATWGSGREERQEVVCEQPVSAQVKAGASLQNQGKPSHSASVVQEEGSGQGTPTSARTHEQLIGDGAAALPDELVSIIPEDLVRGVWNTARTFITRINQEMLSPSANGPGKDLDHEDDARSTSPPHTSQDPPQQEEGKEAPRTTTPEAREEPSLPPPLQQLADMGFSNHEMNQCLLTKYNNDVACAVAELIVLNCQ
ncbi:next to BRCA1 gene 1 protein-like isoform X2 [Portunus trituberculatus]|uniref:next to BRCA1 gene 1 protein-like isoform X2 n=1 Tax=Portunus trituberculatus TaxID=210409 RepID=UPI001E1CBC49|nr:next to BRCA1 gene 1 protein-like isoform X2 [Portunus trituberculatus]